MADTDKLVKVGQLDAVADAVIDVISDTNERLNDLNSGFSKLGLSVEDGVLCVEFGEDEELEG